MPEPVDTCRPVTLPSGEMIRVRTSGPLDPAEAAALGEVVDAARARLAAEHPADEGAEALWNRVNRARCDAFLRDAARQAGVRPVALYRLMQGRMPQGRELAAIEAWLTASEVPDAGL